MSVFSFPPTPPGRRLIHYGAIGVTLVGLALSVSELWPQRSVNNSPPVDVANYLGRSPLTPASTPIGVLLPVSHRDLTKVAEKIVAAALLQPNSPSALLHATRLSKFVGPQIGNWMERDYANRIVRLQLESSFIQDSWRGVETRQTDEGDRIEHRDQLLAALADFGVPLTCRVGAATTDDEDSSKSRTVRDLLRTSLAEFHLNQAEISWTATAYTLYLPPQLHWNNRYGERFTFDDLAEAMLSKPLSSESCSGLHLMCGLTTILKVDQDEHILQPQTSERVREFLKARVQEAVASQLSDGSWPVVWAKSGFSPDGPQSATRVPTTSQRLVIAGHLLEWFQMLPRDCQPPEEVIRNGMLWIIPPLLSRSDEELSAEICPCTHALLAVQSALDQFSKSEARASQ